MKKKFKGILDWLQAICMAVIIAIIIENLLFSFAVVSGQSMFPTLDNEDRLLVVRIPYVYKNLNMGDIVIFNPPNILDEKEMFIKRVIAKENDHFFIKEGDLYINGTKQIENYICDEDYLQRNYKFIEGIVPPNMVFVMGDNRNDSNDSRTFGFVEKDKIKGKVLLKIWPLDEMRAFLNPN